MHTCSEQVNEEEKGMPIIVVKDDNTNTSMAKDGAEQGGERVRGRGGQEVCGATRIQQGDLEERQRAGDLGF